MAACPLAVGIAVFVLHEGDGLSTADIDIRIGLPTKTTEAIRVVKSKMAVLWFIFLFLLLYLIQVLIATNYYIS